MPATDLSVVVVTHNGREMALRTLRSARAGCGAIDVEWLVVDSGSEDGTPDAIEAEWADVLVARRANIGFAAANNVALARAQGRYVLLLNPDVEIREGTLEGLVAALDARPGLGAASVTQLGPEGSNLFAIRRFPSPMRKLGEALALPRCRWLRRLQEADVELVHYEREWPADWLVGAFLIVRRDAIEQIGPLDERFFLYAEEKDWCYRLHDAGWLVSHLPAMRITHFGAARPRPELLAQLSHSNVLFAQKHFPRRRAIGVQCTIALNHVLRAAAFAPMAAFSPAARARVRGEALALRVTLRLAPAPFVRPAE